MGIYDAEISNSKAIVLRHQGEDDHSVEIHEGATGASGSGGYAPVPQYLQDRVAQGKRYYVSISFSEVKDAPAISTESTPAPKAPRAVKPAAAKKPRKVEAVGAEVEKAVKKTPIKSAPKSQPKKATAKKS